MPLTTFEPQNKVKTDVSFPKLSLDYQERALIVCIEPEPTVEYVHTLRAPELDQNGKVLREVKSNSKGGEYEANVMSFVGQHLCFGDFNTVADNGVDPDTCPTCKAAVEEDGITPPQLRYAMNIVRYATQPGSWQLRDPYAVSVEAWVFSPGRFNTIVDLAVDAEGDLRKHDLRLGPCENKNFQKYDIHVVPSQAAWLADKQRANYTKETFEKNKCTDLSALIGRKVDKTKALEDIATVIEKTQEAYGRGSNNTVSASAEVNKAVDLANLIPDAAGGADEAQATLTEPTSAGKTMTFEDILNDL